MSNKPATTRPLIDHRVAMRIEDMPDELFEEVRKAIEAYEREPEDPIADASRQQAVGDLTHRMLLIFDCDGVLVDSEVVALAELSAILAENGYTMDAAACGAAFMGRHAEDIRADIEARLGRPLPGGTDGMQGRILARLERELKPVQGVAALLARVDGPRCVASSSDRPRIAATLRWTGLDRFFGEHLFSGLEVPHGKPAPDLFLHAAAAMGFAPAECVVIEDSVFGVQAGVAAGMPVVGFTGGGHSDPGHGARLLAAGARRVAARMEDVPAALAGLSPAL